MKALWAPLAPWLDQFDGLPDVAGLNRLAQEAGIQSGGGRAIRFVTADDSPLGYEQRIFETGEVPTRPGSWHDAYNALCWLAFPRIKAALNARHIRHLAPGRRGAVRDAATLFDECGVIVLHCAGHLVELLKAHAWRQAFWDQRAEMIASLRYLVIGHALYERLHAPYVGLCGKSIHVPASPHVLVSPMEHQVRHADETVAQALEEPRFLAHPKALYPLPLLGIPGFTQDNEDPAYYEDTRQFRPRRGGKDHPRA